MRANQKDLYYLSQLTERIEDVTRSWLGTYSRDSPSQKQWPDRSFRRRLSLAARMEQGAAARQPLSLLWFDDPARYVVWSTQIQITCSNAAVSGRHTNPGRRVLRHHAVRKQKSETAQSSRESQRTDAAGQGSLTSFALTTATRCHGSTTRLVPLHPRPRLRQNPTGSARAPPVLGGRAGRVGVPLCVLRETSTSKDAQLVRADTRPNCGVRQRTAVLRNVDGGLPPKRPLGRLLPVRSLLQSE